MKSTKRRDYSAGNHKRAEGCRFCGAPDPQLHHAVPRSLQGGEQAGNLIPVCAVHHGAIHAKTVDLAAVLTRPEQVHAVKLLGLQRAHILLAPSEHPERRAA